MTIASIAEVTPGGMLIFFPSYKLMQKCDELWATTNVKNHIEKFKKVFTEPKDPSKYQKTMDMYYSAIFSKKKAAIMKKTSASQQGAILMGVCRGRISEGLDFSDNAARCVIIVGIPYPQMVDPRVVLKKDFLDKKMSQWRSNGPDQF